MDRFCKSLVVKCQLLSNANFSRSSMNLNSSAEHSVIYEIFIVWNQVFAIYVSSCPRSYTNLQSFRRYVRGEHLWFFEMYLKVFDKDLPSNLNKSQQDENDFSPVENIVESRGRI